MLIVFFFSMPGLLNQVAFLEGTFDNADIPACSQPVGRKRFDR